MITGDIKNRVDRIWTTFWNNGISNPLSVIEQISYLLFIKRLDDLELAQEKKAQRLGRKVENPRFGAKQQHLRWSQFKHLGDGNQMLRVVRDEVFPFIKTLGGGDDATSYARHMRDAVFLITSPALMASVVDQIDGLPLEDRDTKGDLYEYMLSKLTTAGQNGQFRTPRHIIKMMVALVEPKPDDIICDPACGTAGFLVAAAEHLRELKDASGNLVLNAPGHRQHFNTGMFHGFDFDATMLRIGSMNMMLHGLENPNIEPVDSLAQTSREAKVFAQLEGKVSVVLANPPFKGSVDVAVVADDLLKATGQSGKKGQSAKGKNGEKKGPSAKTELLFLALMLRLLRIGGRAAVVVPDGVLFGSTGAHTAIRRALMESHKLEGVISMPSGVFKPYSGVSTAVIVFTKTGAGGTDHVWFYDMEADGLSLDDKRQEIADNDIPDILRRWRGRDPKVASDRTSKSFFVPKAEIVAAGYDLSLNRYREVEHTEAKHDAPTVILERLRKVEDEIRADLDALAEMLG
ncbi:MAG: hypothetical protein AMXMBFR58_36600 [Phycisphaerae bacterium]